MNASPPRPHDEILAIAFGEVMTGTASVLTDFRVRVQEPGGVTEGTRGNILLNYELLEHLSDIMPELHRMMREQHADRDVLPPPQGPVPHWNSGPRAKDADAFYFCTWFGIAGIVPVQGAALASIGIRMVDGEDRESYEDEYLISHAVLTGLAEALPKVLHKMAQLGETQAPGKAEA